MLKELLAVNDTDIQVTESTDVVETVRVYSVDFLVSQIAAIEAQRDAFVDARNAEIDYINTLLGQAEGKGMRVPARPSPAVAVNQ
jgi:hypothetical protein